MKSIKFDVLSRNDIKEEIFNELHKKLKFVFKSIDDIRNRINVIEDKLNKK